MVKIILTAIILMFSIVGNAQTREELEKQKKQLKKDLEQTESLLNENKAKSKENFLQWKLVNDKVTYQESIIDNIGKDLNILENNLSTTQKEINRYNKLLDTLKQEYAKSMVYAYKNRSNYDFINFVFSSGSFNDAIKRIAYLKSYRKFREMQGANIIRTQDLRKKRLEELTGIKQKKSTDLQAKDEEVSNLEKEQKEKDRILGELKKQGSELSNKIAATKSQYNKVNNAIAAALKKAVEDARKKAAIYAAENKAKKAAADKAAAIERANEVARAKAAAKATAAAAAAAAKAAELKSGPKEAIKTLPTSPNKNPVVITSPKNIAPKNGPKIVNSVPTITTTTTHAATPKTSVGSVLVNDGNASLNRSFKNNKGSLPWPAQGYLLYHNGNNQLPDGSVMTVNGLTIATDIGASVKSIFDGTVYMIMKIDDGTQVVMVQHGEYFSAYSNLSSVTVQSGQAVKTGQTLGKAASSSDGVGATTLTIIDEKNYLDPEKWLQRK